MDEMRRRLEIPPDADTDMRRRFTLESVNCLGCCSLAPVMMVEEHVAGRLTPTSAWQELEATEAEA
jgi:NADH:ubiquinone oxidoreductase subunit E